MIGNSVIVGISFIGFLIKKTIELSGPVLHFFPNPLVSNYTSQNAELLPESDLKRISDTMNIVGSKCMI